MILDWLYSQPRRRQFALMVAILVWLPLHFLVKWEVGRDDLKLAVRAPRLQGPLLDGGTYDSAADGGRVIVYAFVNPSLESSDRQGQAISVWRSKYGLGEKAVFVTVLTGGTDEQQRKFIGRFTLPLDRVVIDRGGTRQEAFKIHGVPTIILVDATGVVRFVEQGVIKSSDTRFKKIMEGYLPQVKARNRSEEE